MTYNYDFHNFLTTQPTSPITNNSIHNRTPNSPQTNKMPCITTKQQLVKWYLAILDAEIEAFCQVTLAQFLDKEFNNLTKMLENASVSASSPLSLTLNNL